MRKINDWENIKENSDFKRLEPGAYICAIKAVEDVPEKEYLKIYFDIVKGDNKGYFQKLYDSDTRKDKKWPIAGTLIRSYKESALSMFKGFITAIEKSNKNYKWSFDEKSLVKKYIGLIIADEEYLNQKGQKRVRNYVASVRSLESIEKGDFTIPALKELDESKVVESQKKEESFVDPFADNNDEVEENTSATEDDSNPWDDGDEDPFS